MRFSSAFRVRALLLVAFALACVQSSCKKGKTYTESYSFERKCTEKDESCVDKQTARLCDDDDKLDTFKCRGSDGCGVDGEGSVLVSCDLSIAREGDRCITHKMFALKHTCSEDGRAQLACVDGAWAKEKSCGRCYYKRTETGIPHLPKTTLECE